MLAVLGVDGGGSATGCLRPDEKPLSPPPPPLVLDALTGVLAVVVAVAKDEVLLPPLEVFLNSDSKGF